MMIPNTTKESEYIVQVVEWKLRYESVNVEIIIVTHTPCHFLYIFI